MASLRLNIAQALQTVNTLVFDMMTSPSRCERINGLISCVSPSSGRYADVHRSFFVELKRSKIPLFCRNNGGTLPLSAQWFSLEDIQAMFLISVSQQVSRDAEMIKILMIPDSL